MDLWSNLDLLSAQDFLNRLIKEEPFPLPIVADKILSYPHPAELLRGLEIGTEREVLIPYMLSYWTSAGFAVPARKNSTLTPQAFLDFFSEPEDKVCIMECSEIFLDPSFFAKHLITQP